MRQYGVRWGNLLVRRQSEGPRVVIVWDDAPACEKEARALRPRARPEEEPGLVLPSVVHKVRPKSPEAARKARAGATVVLEPVPRADGTVGDVCVVRADRPRLGFARAAVRAVRQWRYEPAKRDGPPVELAITPTVFFRVH